MAEAQRTFTVFQYIPELDCFVVDQTFAAISERLGLVEWHPVVWLGRLFMQDNDFGEHWFDNWKLREGLAERAAKILTARSDWQSHFSVIEPSRIRIRPLPAS